MSPDAFPSLHPRPRAGWVNDPNGPVRWGGRYHLFFQHNPDAPVHAAICWGHLSSADLVHWEPAPVALEPSPGTPDSGGCWSGCVVDDGGVATAVYTAVADDPANAVICLARASDDSLNAWAKDRRPAASAPPGLALSGIRDPFVFTYGNVRYAVVGAGEAAGGRGMVLLFRCDDLASWTYLGVLLDMEDPVASETAAGDFWECPQIFATGDRWVIILSLVVEPRPDRVFHLVGDLVEHDGGLRFVAQTGGLLDHGHDFYAPAILQHDGRTLLWGWSWEDAVDVPPPGVDWAGSLTLTREVALGADDRLHSRPAAEIALLHAAEHTIDLIGPAGSTDLPSGPLDLAIELNTDEGAGFTLEIAGMRLDLDLRAGTVGLERDVRVPWRSTWSTLGSIDRDAREHRLRIILDGSVAEVFVAGGPCFTERIEPTASPRLEFRGPVPARCRVRARPLVPRAQTSGV